MIAQELARSAVPNSMLDQVHSLPDLIRSVFDAYEDAVAAALDRARCLSLARLYVTGCGDSHHAALAVEMAFERLSGVPTEPMTSLQCGRYVVDQLAFAEAGANLVVGISVSGKVARTAEALAKARRSGAATLAVTSGPESPVAVAAERVLFAKVPDFPDGSPNGTPGVRSYACNQLVLLLMAVRLGEMRGRLTAEDAASIRRELRSLADAAARAIDANDREARALAEDWAEAGEFVFLGGGPNYGTALFSAAKLIEACGDFAIGQDTEEWAHLQYYTRARATPTFVISAGDLDLSRALEVAAAAKTIGRRVVAVMPEPAAAQARADRTLILPSGVRELVSPVVAAIPGELFAAYRSSVLGETFFRVGRGLDVSRIRTSEILAT